MNLNLCAVCDKHPLHDPLGVCYKQLTKGGAAYILQCALGTRYNPHSCRCDIHFYGELPQCLIKPFGELPIV